jgi:chromosome segregation ATPase
MQLGKAREHISRLTADRDKFSSYEAKMEAVLMERDEAVGKFNESARASGSLLQKITDIEHQNESLHNEITSLKELAESRKKIIDKQAVESQESNAKFTEKLEEMLSQHESSSKEVTVKYEEEVKALKHTCKRQEQELIRINQQDRVKTRELDTLNQQIRDLQSNVASLDNSKGWFERALKDAEKSMQVKEDEWKGKMDQLNSEHLSDIDDLRSQLTLKDEEVTQAQQQVEEVKKGVVDKDSLISRLKQDVKDEVHRQKLVEKKGLSTMKDLKRQLNLEKKKTEKLQEKLRDISSSDANVDELFQHPPSDAERRSNNGDGSSVSSFSFIDLITNKQSAGSDNSNSHVGSSSASTNQHPAHPPLTNQQARE